MKRESKEAEKVEMPKMKAKKIKDCTSELDLIQLYKEESAEAEMEQKEFDRLNTAILDIKLERGIFMKSED
jgi:hypothetical protein